MPYAIENAIPGLPRLSKSASSIIENMLSGQPSPNEARLANAYYGSGSGLDVTSDFLRNRGFDLYKRDANARQQQGFKDLLSLVGTYSGAVAPTPGQELQDRQQTNQLNQQANQFNQTMGFEREQYGKQLDLLNQYLGPGGGGGASPNVGAAAGFNNRGLAVDIYGNPLNQADYQKSMFIANGGQGGFPTPQRQYAFGPNLPTPKRQFTLS